MPETATTTAPIEVELQRRERNGKLCLVIYGFANHPYRYGNYDTLEAAQAAARQENATITNLESFQQNTSS